MSKVGQFGKRYSFEGKISCKPEGIVAHLLMKLTVMGMRNDVNIDVIRV